MTIVLVVAMAVVVTALAGSEQRISRDPLVRVGLDFKGLAQGMDRRESLLVKTKLEAELSPNFGLTRLADRGEELDALLEVQGARKWRKPDPKRGKNFVSYDLWGELGIGGERERVSGSYAWDASSASDEEYLLTMAVKSFALEARNRIQWSLDRIYRRRPDWPRIDFEYAELDKERRKTLGIRKGKGPVVTGVTRGGAATRAGLQVGDVIERDGKDRLSTPSGLTAAIYRKGPGGTLALTVVRAGSPVSLTYTIPRK